MTKRLNNQKINKILEEILISIYEKLDKNIIYTCADDIIENRPKKASPKKPSPKKPSPKKEEFRRPPKPESPPKTRISTPPHNLRGTSYYEVLGLQRNSTIAEIKKRYYILAKKYHPDRGGEQEKFKIIQVAYNILSDPETRRQYDTGFIPFARSNYKSPPKKSSPSKPAYEPEEPSTEPEWDEDSDEFLKEMKEDLGKIMKEMEKEDDDDAIDTLTERMRRLKKQIKEYILEKKSSKNDCITRSKVPLRIYQTKAIKFINDPKQHSLLIVHGTGTGKTLTALTASQCYLDRYPDNKVIVISPASITENFEKEMKKYGGQLSNKYVFYSFHAFNNINSEKDYDCKNTMVIIDEAHNLKSRKQQFKSVFACVKHSHKLLLLTATPFINELSDFKSLLFMLYRNDDIIKERKEYLPEKITNENTYRRALLSLLNLLRGKVTFLNDKKSSDFPQFREHRIDIPMTPEYFAKYKKALREDREYGDNPETFFHGYRQAVNEVGVKDYVNQKLNIILELIKHDKHGRWHGQKDRQTLIFTNWLDSGVKILRNSFSENNISFLEITGDVAPDKRMDIVEQFNNKDVQVLIITLAGSEGLDLKGVRDIIILDPVWNPAKYEQIIGRGIRYKSHEHLPPDERFVDVYQLLLISRSTEVPSGDEILYSFIESKKHVWNDVVKVLQEASI